MGTKADFYIGTGPDSIWLGSIAWDGQPGQVASMFSKSMDESTYLKSVRDFLKSRPDATINDSPSDHWPWPWDSSINTNFSYSFDDGEIKVSHFGGIWTCIFDHKGYEFPQYPKMIFPNMIDRKMSTIGESSGIVIVKERIMSHKS